MLSSFCDFHIFQTDFIQVWLLSQILKFTFVFKFGISNNKLDVFVKIDSKFDFLDRILPITKNSEFSLVWKFVLICLFFSKIPSFYGFHKPQNAWILLWFAFLSQNYHNFAHFEELKHLVCSSFQNQWKFVNVGKSIKSANFLKSKAQKFKFEKFKG